MDNQNEKQKQDAAADQLKATGVSKDPQPVRTEKKEPLLKGDQKKAAQGLADVKVNAQDLLDPSTPSVEADHSLVRGLEAQGGSSYPTAEALQAEREGKEKLQREKDQKELKKAPKEQKNETRSAVNPAQTAVIHPGAAAELERAQKEALKHP